MKIKMYKGIATAVLLALVMMFGSIIVIADELEIDPFRIESENAARVFYFNPFNDEHFPTTGVYYNTEPLELIYEVRNIGMATENSFDFSSDFDYFAFFPLLSPQVGLEFYANGVLTRRYLISELVDNMDLVVSYTASMAIWTRSGSRAFDSANNTLNITTVEDVTYIFDVTTGEILEYNDINAITAPSFGIIDDEAIDFINMDIAVGLAVFSLVAALGCVVVIVVQRKTQRQKDDE